MTLTYISRISQSDITERDIFWLAKRDLISYDDTTGADLARDILTGYKQLWRFSGGPQGVLVTSVQKTTMNLDFLAGRGLIKYSLKLLPELVQLARQVDCAKIDCTTSSATLRKLYNKLGFVEQAVQMRYNFG